MKVGSLDLIHLLKFMNSNSSFFLKVFQIGTYLPTLSSRSQSKFYQQQEVDKNFPFIYTISKSWKKIWMRKKKQMYHFCLHVVQTMSSLIRRYFKSIIVSFYYVWFLTQYGWLVIQFSSTWLEIILSVQC
jgi:hypothetical protein